MEQTLGKRISENRRRLGYTQDQLAEQLGVTAQAVSKWENDQSCPDISTLPKLAEIFGISIDELLGYTSAHPICDAEIIDDSSRHQSDGGKWNFHWENGKFCYMAFAVFILLVGCISLATTVLHKDVNLWNITWPSALLVFGLFWMFSHFSFFSLGCSLFGGYFLLNYLHVFHFDLGAELVIPIVLVLLGLSLLVDALRKKVVKPQVHVSGTSNKHRVNCIVADDHFSCSTSFGEDKQHIDMKKMNHGSVACSFGNLTVDLSGVQAVEEYCQINADCSFGELTLLVPEKFKVDPTSEASFGSVVFSGQPDSSPEGIIHLKADASFGAISVKYI